MTIAQTITQQLGFALNMIGAKNLLDHGDALSFRIGRNARRVNMIKVTLDPSDTYTVTFSRVPSVRALCNGAETVILAEVAGVYAGSLHDVLERHTGLATRL